MAVLLMDVEIIKQTKNKQTKNTETHYACNMAQVVLINPIFLFTVLARKLNTWGTSLSLLMETGMFC